MGRKRRGEMFNPEGFEGLDLGRVDLFSHWLESKIDDEDWDDVPEPVKNALQTMAMNEFKWFCSLSKVHMCPNCLKEYETLIYHICGIAVTIALHPEEVQEAIKRLAEVGEV